MKLSDLTLTNDQAAALLRLLDREIAGEQARRTAEMERAEAGAAYEAQYQRLSELATITAQLHGPIVGMPAIYQAAAAWEAFAASEGWFSPYDVAERFTADENWRKTWELRYTDALGRVKRGTLPRLTENEAMR